MSTVQRSRLEVSEKVSVPGHLTELPAATDGLMGQSHKTQDTTYSHERKSSMVASVVSSSVQDHSATHQRIMRVFHRNRSTSISVSPTEEEDIEVRSQVEKEAQETMMDEMFLSRFGSLPDRTKVLPRVRPSEVVAGKILGKGAFSNILEMRAATAETGKCQRSASLSNVSDHSTAADESLSFHQSCSVVNAKDTMLDDQSQHVLKRLRDPVVQSPTKYKQGMIDLAIEARILSNLDHPNIVKLRAISTAQPWNGQSFFLIVDRLHDTLEDRLAQWSIRARPSFGWKIQKTMDPQKLANSFLDRVETVSSLAQALQYLHKHRVIHRDIKPNNIGFDANNELKLFDFGMARSLPDSKTMSTSDGTFHMSCTVGSPRYMAPEVANGESYNESCDVYSFSLVAWQVLSMNKPYADKTCLESFRECVWIPDSPLRPCLEEICVPDSVSEVSKRNLTWMLSQSWTPVVLERLSMEKVAKLLQTETCRIRLACCDRGSSKLLKFGSKSKPSLKRFMSVP